ncbi:MAG TPA: glycoside hydrolase family 127 protein [Draconibacterium sp.]|nr:glycoside hydrolase family 127 protein [Draconibacterium sp.]
MRNKNKNMVLKYGIVFSALLFVISSCSRSGQLPQKISEKTAINSVILNHSFLQANYTFHNDSVIKSDFGNELEKLFQEKRKFEDNNSTFNLTGLENTWKTLQNQRNNFNLENIKQWIEITGFLLELSGNTAYANELEEIIYKGATLFNEQEYNEIEKKIVPWIFTKDLDNIYVNLFASASIKYDHSLKGAVEIVQEANYPESGKIKLKFKMEEKRYIELFIRIPEWAEDATVTETGVKYVANPGTYSQILRKWGEGDSVVINFPIEKMPKQ